ncbi:MAG TPA: DUF3108 domain-containing protein [Steroidobacteraceae bacterium]|nr:DUF3108 domain-containing protein [Steroidobacteraceae bacterium]
MQRFAIGVLLALSAAAVSADAPQLQPFRASYQLVWRGFDAGKTELKLERQADGQYLYTSRSNASGLFHAFFSNEISQTSWFTVTPDGIRPDRYRGDDGSSKTARDISLDFNWESGRATGVAEDTPVDVALEPHTQDDMSIQIALIYALLKGDQLTSLRLIDKNRIKEYTYTSEGTAQLKTALGELDTVVYRSQRAGSKRVTRMWYAPSLGFIPVRGEQLREGKREWYMEIRTLQRE